MLRESAQLAPTSILAALNLVETGEIIDLDSGRWPGMPLWSGHPPFQVLTYRSPGGIRAQHDQAWLAPAVNSPNLGLISELVMGTSHSGTHIDALAHFTRGPHDQWHDGVTAEEALGDFGPLRDDATSLPALLCRGVLVDVAGAKGVGRLDKGYEITADDLREALDRQESTLKPGDAVLVRTGQMAVWPDVDAMEETRGSGIGLDAADMLVDCGAVVVGVDTESCEVVPSRVEGNPHPVHERLLIDHAVYIIENIPLEELAGRRAYQFLFIALPLKIKGATASMLRPVAVL